MPNKRQPTKDQWNVQPIDQSAGNSVEYILKGLVVADREGNQWMVSFESEQSYPQLKSLRGVTFN